MKIDNFVIKEDFSLLPIQLLEDFATVIKLLLQLNPLNFCGAYSSYVLLGELQGYRALEIDFDDSLVCRVYDSPSPRCVVIISFAEHNPAYSRV